MNMIYWLGLGHRSAILPLGHQRIRRIRQAWLVILMGVMAMPAAGAETLARTNSGLTSLQRLEPEHLKATHEARLRFEKERRPVPNHGLYEDFRGIMHAH